MDLETPILIPNSRDSDSSYDGITRGPFELISPIDPTTDASNDVFADRDTCNRSGLNGSL